jgi:thymidylate synthase (FAD)
MKCNLREWRHVFKLRAQGHAHPSVKEIMIPLLNELKDKLPEIFNDIEI